MFPKRSPDNTRLGYIRGHNLYVEGLADGKVTALTADGSDKGINGTFDWVYEEELDLRDRYLWHLLLTQRGCLVAPVRAADALPHGAPAARRTVTPCRLSAPDSHLHSVDGPHGREFTTGRFGSGIAVRVH